MSNSLKQMAYDTIEAHQETIADLHTQLEKANERVKKLEKERDHSQRMYNSLLGDLSAGYGKSSIAECEKHLNKFAIEKQLETAKKCAFGSTNWVLEHIKFLEEQLRKEQE